MPERVFFKAGRETFFKFFDFFFRNGQIGKKSSAVRMKMPPRAARMLTLSVQDSANPKRQLCGTL